MKVKASIIRRFSTPTARMQLALRLGIGPDQMRIHLKDNKSDGYLTKMKALLAISAETGVGINEILETDKKMAQS